MKSKAIFMALLVLAFGAQAGSVSQSQAAVAARQWAQSGTVLGTRFGTAVDVAGIRTFSVSADAVFHAVPFKGGGMVFVSANTDAEPVVAFTSSRHVDLSEKSPLYRLLCLDARFRARQAAVRAARMSGAATATGTTSEAGVRRKWDSLMISATPVGKSADPIQEVSAAVLISDMRVEPLMWTRWSQTTHNDYPEAMGGLPCYNYYTTNGYPCGCTATATAQIMRYFQYPEKFQGSQTEFPCAVDGRKAALSVLTDEAGELLPYDWNKMINSPSEADPAPDENSCAAIGHLTYDVAVALESSFAEDETGVSQDGIRGLAKKLIDCFGYKNACLFNDSPLGQFSATQNGLHDKKNLKRVVFANLDAAKPVLFGIFGYAKDASGALTTQTGGHAVVADGYGFTRVNGVDTPYVHINLGWSGTDDAWYNIPEIDTAQAGATAADSSGYDFLFLNTAAYNISTEEAEADKDILSGRVLDEAGAPVANAPVRLVATDGSDEAVVMTDKKGIYAAILTGGKNYEIGAALDDGRLGETASPVELKHNDVSSSISNIIVKTTLGNSWGNDFTVFYPTVRVIRGAETNLYPTLDKALAAAAGGARIEILETARLERNATLDFDCTIVATNADPFASPVICTDGAMLVVSGGTTSFSNVVFQSSSATVKSTGGTISVADIVSFDDIVSGTPGLLIESSAEFKVYGSLGSGITLACEKASSVGNEFGVFVGDGASASNAAVRIVSPNGSHRAGSAKLAYPGVSDQIWKLEWADDATVDPAVAVGYVVGPSAVRTCYRTLDELFASNPNGATVVITKSGAALSEPQVLSGTYSIGSSVEDGARIVVSAETAFMVKGTLTASGLDFADFRGNGLFVVDGADAALTLTNTVFQNIEGTNFHSGAIAVLDGGRLTVRDDVRFENCRATGKCSATRTVPASGGAIYVAAGGRLDLIASTNVEASSGIVITNSFASASGGGVYAAGTTNEVSAVSVAGNVVIAGNSSGESATDNIRLLNGGVRFSCAERIVSDPASIGVGYSGEGKGAFGNANGDSFVTLGASVDVATKKAFFNDVTASLSAAVSADGKTLVWTDSPDNRVPRADAVCEVSGAGTAANGFYATFEDAVKAMNGRGVITLFRSVDFYQDIELAGDVTIASTNDPASVIRRHSDASFVIPTGASLTLTNVVAEGRSSTTGLFKVDGGALTLLSGAKVTNVRGSADRRACAVSVCKGGTFTMESGSEISNCLNDYVDSGNGATYGGALLVEDGSKAYLNGGLITGCSAYSAGGVFIGSSSAVYLSGDMIVSGNRPRDGYWDDNLCVADDSSLILTGPGEFKGSVGFNEGYQADTNVFGRAEDYVTDVQAAAHKFRHDYTGDYGMAVTNGNETLLVWSAALDEDGNYTDATTGKTYLFVDGAAVRIERPTKYTDMVYDGLEWMGVPESPGYEISGVNTAVDAGTYQVTVTLRKGFEWSDGGTEDLTIDWEIEKAVYVLEGITFEDEVYPYVPNTMQYHSGIQGELPDWLDVTYRNNGRTEPGTNEVTAVISGTNPNYEPFTDSRTAKLIILPPDEPVPPPGPVPPGPTEVTNTPTPIAFQSITRVSDLEWSLVVTSIVPKCEYRLIFTDDLAKGFTVTGAWERAADDADPSWKTNVLFTTENAKPAYFWRAEGRQTIDVISNED